MLLPSRVVNDEDIPNHPLYKMGYEQGLKDAKKAEKPKETKPKAKAEPKK